MCENCTRETLAAREENNKMVKDRIAKGLPLHSKEGTMGIIGHIHLGYPCIHEMEPASRPPLGLIPKWLHDEKVNTKRLNEVCGAITRYYGAGLKIDPKWIEEYNELIDIVSTCQKYP